VWDRVPTARPVVALTFDAGADDAGAAKILPTLRSSGVPATFFITGRFALTYPDVVRDIARTYAIANHTYDHRDLTKLADAAAADEVTSAATVMRQVTGRDPLPLFRFPFGAENGRLRGLVNRLGYGDIRWTVDTLGWMGTSGGQGASTALGRVLAQAGPGEIVLMHVGAHPKDHSTIDADALGAIIAALRARGYSFVSLEQFLV
jgi:peptidoglycan/xylan/chitin deacetylase (PgdA/CDA1 family)